MYIGMHFSESNEINLHTIKLLSLWTLTSIHKKSNCIQFSPKLYVANFVFNTCHK